MNNSCIIIVPVYKKHMNNWEYVSFARLCKLIKNEFDICLLTYEELDVREYINIANTYGITLKSIYYDKKYFENTSSYSLICLDIYFYISLNKYKYMFLYQLDCYLFKNDIQYWIDKDLDQIECVNEFWISNTNFELFYNGEGLRKIQAVINTLDKYHEEVASLKTQLLLDIICNKNLEYKCLFTNSWTFYKSGEDRFFTKYLSNGIIHENAFEFGLSFLKDKIGTKYKIPMMIHYYNKDDEWSLKNIGDPDIDKEICINKVFD